MTDRALQTATLRAPNAALEASFLPRAGMLCCSLRHAGQELLAQNSGVAAYAERGELMGIPLLYPWANRLADFEYQLEGRAISIPRDPALVALDTRGLPIHGVIGGRQNWELTSALAPDSHSLTARLSWSERAPDLFELFPFRHDLAYRAALSDGGLELELTVHACGTDPVPLAFGYHPYVSLPGVRREAWLIELPPMRRLELDQEQIPTGPGERMPARSFPLADLEFDDGFDDVPATARFVATAGDRRIELQFVEGYPYAQVFAPKDGQFACFEPMVAPTNALRSGVGLRVLRPGETFRARFSLRVSSLPRDEADRRRADGR